LFYLVDACQSVGQRVVNVREIECDSLVGTGRKYLRGPRGTGFLYVKLPDALEPFAVDHYSTTVQVPKLDISNQQPIEKVLEFSHRPGAKRFEFWESNIANKLGLGVAARLAIQTGLDRIEKVTVQRALSLYQQLLREHRLHVHHGPPESGIVTFWVEGMDSAALKEALWQGHVQFEVSVVPATSTPLDSGVPDLVRASVSYTTTVEEIELFCKRLASLIPK
jgi:selenocysteine lyase/cysteine desulfurase